ncbi:MinD/ParA family ATP-binding protein [Nocardia brasiliensis]|uniref:MinD/ParA family ATP-binding protein n=1 Tax=Nocardia brasiliensis TaxID=37326 RepID=UPI002458F550|nr:MinD/ParA family protein [Nocardia brasiliensis]
MDRAPNLNGERNDSGQARSGYDAYFAGNPGSASAASPPAQAPEPRGYVPAGQAVVGRPAAEPPQPAHHPAEPDPAAAAPAVEAHSAGPLEQIRNNPPAPHPPHLQPTPPRPAQYAEHRTEAAASVEVLPAVLSSSDLLAEIAATRRAQLRSNSGMRGALNKVGFRLGLSPAEQRTEQRRGRIRRQLTASYQIAVVSVKGGAGRTTAVATLGSTFAALRPDRVVAIDANPGFGDLAVRTRRHPYGLTLRDLAHGTRVDAFSAVSAYTSINTSDLAVVACPWTPESTEALSGQEYAAGVEVLRRHYNLLLVDCGTGVLDSVTGTVLRSSDAVVVITPATVGGVSGAVATLNWLNTHGLHHLAARSIVAIAHHHADKPIVDIEAIEQLFATVQRPTCQLPYDPHLAEGGEIDLRLLGNDTLLAFEDLAAWLADGFPGYLFEGGDDPGGRR